MTDLTVLVSPLPLYPDAGASSSFPFRLRSMRNRTPAHPIMVTLETEIDHQEPSQSQSQLHTENNTTQRQVQPDEEADSSSSSSTQRPVFPNPSGPRDSSSNSSSNSNSTASPVPPSSSSSSTSSSPGVAAPSPRRPQRIPNPHAPIILDQNLLSPPVNTWKAARPAAPRHRPTRSRSAPPERRSLAPGSDSPAAAETPFARARAGPAEVAGGAAAASPSIYHRNPAASLTTTAFTFNQPPSLLLGGGPPAPRFPKRSFTSFTADRQTTQGGELVRPPPPLLRPTTFWRKTRRSGVTGASYSPASHLIRRSTYVAAGLAFDAPVHDLSALCVESRVGFIVVPPDQELL